MIITSQGGTGGGSATHAQVRRLVLYQERFLEKKEDEEKQKTEGAKGFTKTVKFSHS